MSYLCCSLFVVSLTLPDIISQFNETQENHTNFCCIVDISNALKKENSEVLVRVYKGEKYYRIDYLTSKIGGSNVFDLSNPNVTQGYILNDEEIIEYTRSPSGGMTVLRHASGYEPILATLDHYFITPINSLYEISGLSVADLCQLPTAKIDTSNQQITVTADKVSDRAGAHRFSAIIDTSGQLLVIEWRDEMLNYQTIANAIVYRGNHPVIGPVVEKFTVDSETTHPDWPATHSTTTISDYSEWNDDSAFKFESLFLFGDQIAVEKDGKQSIIFPPDRKKGALGKVQAPSSWIWIVSLNVVILGGVILVWLYRFRSVTKKSPVTND